MGKIYNSIKRIFEKEDKEYSLSLIEKFIVLVTFEDTYLMQKLVYRTEHICFALKKSGEDMFIDCINFGIIITPKDEVSTHT